MTFDRNFIRYLAAKKSIDDRALNRNVLDVLRANLSAQTIDAPLRVIEVGAGTGTMLEYLIERDILTHAKYTAIDLDAASIAELNRRLVCPPGVTIESEAIDVFDFIARERGRRTWDVLVAKAFLDMLDPACALPQLFALLRPGGLFYFTINFDGATIFEPVIDAAFDGEIERLYHQTMDERVTNGARSGDSRTGRRMFHRLHECGAEILQAGSSDWVLFAGKSGFSNDEAYFLHFIIDTARGALEHHPELIDRRAQFSDWIARRHRQIDEGTLVYIAHQLDFVGRR